MIAGLRRRLSGSDVAALILLWAVALSVSPPLIAEDTKNDLYVDAWGFLRRALHLWDPQVTWGVLQNQGYGYLFPMGPFFAITTTVLPTWVAQRIWWGLLLTAGYLGMRVLLRGLLASDGTTTKEGVRRAHVLGALAYAASPRVMSTVGGLSSETLPVVMAPWILAPLVLADRGRLAPRRAAALSGLAVLTCGGVNAAAVFFAALPAAVWLLTRHRWWRRALTWWSLLAVFLATAWWLGPLVVLGRYSPPFMDWIETSSVVSGPVGLLDVARGTTHWLARLVTPAGPWWPAAYDIASTATGIIATTVVAALGLAGLARRDLPERRFLLVTGAVGLVFLALPHAGPFASPAAAWMESLLDGLLAPLRNVHKADPLVRLALAVAMTHALARLAAWRPDGSEWRRPVAWAMAMLAVFLLMASPLSQGIATRGAFPDMAAHWRSAGQWLTEHAEDGPALIVPAASFGEYTWGRTIDEPLRPLTTAPYAVRDSVPLTPAGTIRLLDEVEQRLQSGRSIGGAVAALRASGTRYLVLRNDLAAYAAGQPPVTFARSALRDTPGVTWAAAFGTSFLDDSGTRVQPVEIYDLGPAAALVETWPLADLRLASGASEALPDLAEAGVTGPVIFDGDLVPAVADLPRLTTDSYRARERFFGGVRGRDASSSLTAAEDARVRDYRPWEGSGLRSVRVADLTMSASSSLATNYGLLGLWPAAGPYAAIDGDVATAWATAFDPHPVLRLDLGAERSVPSVRVVPLTDDTVLGSGLGIASRIRVATAHGAVESDLSAAGTTVSLPEGDTRWLEVEVLSTETGPPTDVVMGIAELQIPGLEGGSRIRVADAGDRRPELVVLATGARTPDGCVVGERGSCLAHQLRTPEEVDLRRLVPTLPAGHLTLSGTIAVDPRNPPRALTRPTAGDVRTSSASTPAALGGWFALVDGDPSTGWQPGDGDREPWIEVDLAEPTTIHSVSLNSRRGWGDGETVYVVVTIDGSQQTLHVPMSGRIEVGPRVGSRLRVDFMRPVGSSAWRPSVESFLINDRELSRGQDTTELSCGQGPTLLLDGQVVLTKAEIPDDAMAGRDIAWSACGPEVAASDGPHTIDATAPAGFMMRTLVVRGGAESKQGAGSAHSDAHWRHPAAIQATVEPDQIDRVLVTTVNSNPGWQASIEGQELVPVVVDGFRQAFVVPAGIGGSTHIEFAPDRPYRWLLGGGALLILGLVVLLLAPSRSPSPQREQLGHRRLPSSWVPVVASVLAGGVLLGGAGLLVGLAAGVLATWERWPRPLTRVRQVAPTLLLTGAAALQAVVSPGGLGPVWLEATSRVLVTAALLGACVVGSAARVPAQASGSTHEGQLEPAVAEPRQAEGDWDPEGQQGE